MRLPRSLAKMGGEKKKDKKKYFPLRFCFERFGVIWVCNIYIKGGVKEMKEITRKY